jgi:predicted unusual protein kinase regulating ubiquinone biosynthesis (AarF/ABC1/UbiB family)
MLMSFNISGNQPSFKTNPYPIKKQERTKDTAVLSAADTASGVAALGVFFKIKRAIQLNVAKFYTLGNKELIDNITKNFKKFGNITKKLDKKSTAIMAATATATIVGGVVKNTIMKVYNSVTGKYKLDKEELKNKTKAEKKAIKKELTKAKRSENFRNSLSGAINGLLTPIVGLGGIIGAPIYAAANALNRYFVGTKEEDGKPKTFSSFVDNLKNSKFATAIASASVLIPAAIHGHTNKIFEGNLSKTIDKLKNTTLTPINNTKSSYEHLEDILFSNDKINSILNSNLEVSKKIQALSDENIFALKFKQIRSNADNLAKALKTDCPATRTLDEAQKLISKSFGDKYELQSLVGVGTIAETYLVKDKSGKEFCIKMLKNGISTDKISKDKDAFINIINNMSDISKDEKNFLIKNLENIAQGVISEVDFINEKNSAEALSKVTKQAKVVVPVEVKDNMYVMEKANGISLQNLLKYLSDKDSYKWDLDFYSKRLKEAVSNSDKQYYADKVKNAQAQLESIQKLSKDIGDLSKDEAKKLMEKYQDVIIEQFSKVDKSGKIIHGDIHPGNIFIDINAMRKGDKNFFTLIDTGNTIKQSQESALRFLNLSTYIKNADIENITNFVLEGATLPQNMTKEQAFENISKELSKAFFDDKTYIGHVTNDSLLGITDGIMKNLNIIPSDTQGNLLKSKTSADQSMQEFQQTFVNAVMKNIEQKFEGIDMSSSKNVKDNLGKIIKEGAAAAADIGISSAKYPIKKSIQEKQNLAKLNLADKAKIKKSKSTPNKNSEEYLTYLLKQNKPLKESSPLNNINLDNL